MQAPASDPTETAPQASPMSPSSAPAAGRPVAAAPSPPTIGELEAKYSLYCKAMRLLIKEGRSHPAHRRLGTPRTAPCLPAQSLQIPRLPLCRAETRSELNVVPSVLGPSWQDRGESDTEQVRL